jgi:hypothetical protein
MAINIPIISEFDSKGIKNAINEFKSLEGAGAKAQFALKKAALPAAAALTALAGAATLSVKAAIEDQAQQQELARQIQSVTGATDAQIKENEKLIASMERQFAVSDGQLRPALGNLVRGTGDLTRAQKLMEVALDISAATGKDLESVTIALSKAENGQMTALQRLGIPLGENAKGTKALEAANKELTKATEAHQKLLDDYSSKIEITDADMAKLEKSTNRLAEAEFQVAEASKLAGDFAEDLANVFGGAASKSAETLEGRTKRMAIAIDNAKENIGFALLPVVEKIIPVLERMSYWMQDNTKVIVILGGVIGGLAAAVLAINFAMKVYQATLVIVKVAQMALNFVMAANPIGLVIVAIAALVAGFVILEKKFGVVSKAMEFLGAGFQQFIINPLRAVLDLVGKVISALGKIPGVSSIAGAVGGLVGKIPGLAEGGIVTSPTLAMIGEGGEPEAVIPLSKMGQMGNVTININSAVADASLGDIIVNALKQYNRRSGPVQVQIA